MKLLHTLFFILPAAAVSADPVAAATLNITAISSRNGYSVLECWQLDTIPVAYLSAINYAIGNTTTATWSRIEPRTTPGEAWAPQVQLSIILNGLIRITAPAPVSTTLDIPVCVADELTQGHAVAERVRTQPKTQVAYVMPGTMQSSVLIAADLKATSNIRGHFTEFPSGAPTVLMQIPFEGDRVPVHRVLYEGPCV
ncbi:uncharacterized protein C8A04DRAFT_15521 [Dichotomopilus funicola]|uniref:Uncharacterized protein n=1 Tax=Dichotomopilus funicola TaxID=1934379 RepID=A0AAN6ZJK9_9PEZI|nr:hypothetical protein C8A04DRAFT_15521 [Dichotomopilus funicola]